MWVSPEAMKGIPAPGHLKMWSPFTDSWQLYSLETIQRVKVPRTIILEITKKNTMFIGQVVGMGFCNHVCETGVYLLEFEVSTSLFYFLLF